MAFGKNWEWRGFGAIPPELRERLELLPSRYPSRQDLTDEYLWVQGSPVNIKLRFSDLKFKRLIERDCGLERWLEDPAENYSFPIGREVLLQLATDLGVSIPVMPHGAVDRSALLALLEKSTPAVRLVAVTKSRWQRKWTEGGSAGEGVTVEVAQILSPEITWSVGVESPESDLVRKAVEALGLEGVLRRLNYLEALGVWVKGHRVSAEKTSQGPGLRRSP